MKLSLITPLESQEYTIEWLEVITTTGTYLLEEDHEPMVASLKPDSTILFLNKNNERITKTIKSGFVLVERKHITLLLKE